MAAKKVAVTSPIYVRLSTSPPSPDWRCAYLDSDTWSFEGVWLATPAELLDHFGEDTAGVWCATLHLSIFSAVVDLLLDCTNLNVLAEENLKEILVRKWWMRPPALLLGLLVITLLALVSIGLKQDSKVRRLGIWKAEYFLTEVPPISKCTCTSLFASMTSILSKCWRQPKKFAPELVAEKSVDAFVQFRDWAKHMDRNLEPGLPFKMQELVLCLNTLREVALQQKLHPSFMMAHIWGPNGWIQGSLAIQKSPKLKKLHIEMQETLPKAFTNIHSSRWRRLCFTSLSAHPVGELWQWNLHITAAKRAKIMMDCILGPLAALEFAGIMMCEIGRISTSNSNPGVFDSSDT